MAYRTIETREKHLDKFFRFCQKNNVSTIEQISKMTIRSYLTNVVKSGLSASYANNILKSIRSFFLFMEEEDYIQQEKNPCLRVKFLKEEKKLITAFTNSDLRKMLDYYGNKGDFMSVRNKLLILVLADTGLRISELIRMKAEDFQESTITVLGKGSKQRMIFISPVIRRHMIKYLRVKKYYFMNKRYDNNSKQFLFCNFYGDKLNADAINRMLKRTAKEVGVSGKRVSCHTLRHYFAQTYLKNDGDLYTLSRLLGHSNLNTTKVYLNSMTDSDFIEKAGKYSPMSNLYKNQIRK